MINKANKLTGPFLVGLRNKFRVIAGDDQLIDRSEFQQGMEIINEEISNRLFDIFDKDKDGTIDFSEFMETIESIVDGTELDKIRFAFNLHDLDSSGFIDKNELKLFIEQSFIENQLDYDEFQLELLVNEFFNRADVDHDQKIDFNEFLKVAKEYPDFISGFTVSPIAWLNPERYEKSGSSRKLKKNNIFRPTIQVQDIGALQWLLIPRLIFLYNVLVNRKKNRNFVDLKAIHLLPSKILEFTITKPEGFTFTPGDYIYVNCPQISRMEWYPFNIIHHSDDDNLILHVKTNNRWTNKLYYETVDGLGKNKELDWTMRVDGPYGSSSNRILETEHAIFIGADHGISRFAPILQDIAMRLKDEPEKIKLKRIDLFWLNLNDSYFEWFTKLLNDLEFPDPKRFFNYHIYFVDKSAEEMQDKMMYISTNANNLKTDVRLIENLWDNSRFGLPDWDRELERIRRQHSEFEARLFFSGPLKLKGDLKSICSDNNIEFFKKNF